jgi:Glycine rich protein
MRRFLATTFAIALSLTAATHAPAVAAEPVTVTFASTGAEQEFTVPGGVTSLHVVLVGGKGGSTPLGGSAGFGARVEGDLPVSPGAVLYVVVAGNGGTGTGGGGAPGSGGLGGFNGGAQGGGGLQPGTQPGGGGGGGSDIRTESGVLGSRLIVAGGGGGAGGRGESFTPGAGGNAGSAGGVGGSGGATGGGAGTSSAGGAGGAASGGTSGFGTSGSLGTGGAGADGNAVDPAGGGGGGGLYGGGGGGGGDPQGAGGGGGGSSYAGAATNVQTTVDATGAPLVTISYVLADTGTVNAEVIVPSSAACLELSASSISFGTPPLGAINEEATPQITVTNCSGVSETILARGTNATGSDATWALTDAAAACDTTLGLDAYRLGLDTGPAAGFIQLSTDNKTLYQVAPGGAPTQTAVIDTACPGSTGAGTTMSMQVIFLATE